MKRAVDVIKDIARSPRAEYITAWDAGDGKLSQAGIDTPLRLAHLIAQCAAECGCFHSLRESSNFTHEDVFIHVFNNIKHSTGLLPGEAKMLLGQEKDVAERFYGVGGPSALYAAHQINHGINPGNPNKAQGLGNDRPGDGFLFRGNGMLQTTGGTAHREIAKQTGVDFFNHPELVTSAQHALTPVLFEWSGSHCNGFADNDDVLRISKAINFGDPNKSGTPLGMDDRKKFLGQAKHALGI